MELVDGANGWPTASRGSAAAERSPRHRAADRSGTRGRARAGIVHRDLKPANIRSSPTASSRCSTSVLRRRSSRAPRARARNSDDDARDDGSGVRARYRCVHGARAGARQARRPARRHLGARLRTLRAAVGEPAFLGDDVSSTLARVLEREPDLERVAERTWRPRANDDRAVSQKRINAQTYRGHPRRTSCAGRHVRASRRARSGGTYRDALAACVAASRPCSAP